ncbi:MAG: hypothetical protein V3U44_09700 [Alphaproteobacteria bacterium]
MAEHDTTPHQLIYNAYQEGRIHIGPIFAILNRKGAPDFSQVENYLPYGLLAGLIVIYSFQMGMWGGIAALLFAVLLALRPVPRWILKRLRHRTMDRAFGSEEGWDQLWEIGGLSIRLAADVETMCEAPDGDWQRFAETHLQPINSEPEDTP